MYRSGWTKQNFTTAFSKLQIKSYFLFPLQPLQFFLHRETRERNLVNRDKGINKIYWDCCSWGREYGLGEKSCANVETIVKITTLSQSPPKGETLIGQLEKVPISRLIVLQKESNILTVDRRGKSSKIQTILEEEYIRQPRINKRNNNNSHLRKLKALEPTVTKNVVLIQVLSQKNIKYKMKMYFCCSHEFRETNSLRRTVQIAECGLLHRRAPGRGSSQPRTPTSLCENLIYPKCSCPNPPP